MGLLDRWDARNQRHADADLAASKTAWVEQKRWNREVSTPEGQRVLVVAVPASEFLRPPLPYLPFLAPWNLVVLLVSQVGVPIRRLFIRGWRLGVLSTRDDEYSLARPRILHVERLSDATAAEARLAAIAHEIVEGGVAL